VESRPRNRQGGGAPSAAFRDAFDIAIWLRRKVCRLAPFGRLAMAYMLYHSPGFLTACAGGIWRANACYEYMISLL